MYFWKARSCTVQGRLLTLEVDSRLKQIMKSIHKTSLDASNDYGMDANYVAGANIAGFVKVVNAMLDQGLV